MLISNQIQIKSHVFKSNHKNSQIKSSQAIQSRLKLNHDLICPSLEREDVVIRDTIGGIAAASMHVTSAWLQLATQISTGDSASKSLLFRGVIAGPTTSAVIIGPHEYP